MSTPTPERKPGMSVREAGQKGGETVKKKYGPEFYEMIGRKGGQATKKAHGHAFYEAIGKKGGKKGGEAVARAGRCGGGGDAAAVEAERASARPKAAQKSRSA